MELRTLEYFLAIAQEESITGAANALHMSQPGLTRQLKLLEDELGKQLVIRGNRRLTLTEDGMILRRRAEEIMRLVERTEGEIAHSDDLLSGDVYLCAGETEGVHFLTQAAKRLRDRCPDVRFHISSGDTGDVTEELDKGLIDFGVLFDPIDDTRYQSIPIPYADTWGVLMRKNSPLAKKKSIKATDLSGQPLITPRGPDHQAVVSQLLGLELEQINIVGTYSLIFNASLMVADGIGYAICLDQILNLTGESELCFRPFQPKIEAHMNVVWMRYRTLSRAAAAFLAELQAN